MVGAASRTSSFLSAGGSEGLLMVGALLGVNVGVNAVVVRNVDVNVAW